ncbi:O-antigen/teichoic acid export membrane protein [Bradyrhizobium japonicum]|uniref:lipopolysaccharide biosynthesis protein n=1 Tax=Bradyrhizobium japonicum TaxID=375 RepID=UPI00216AB28D|nr:polysaccharide biosynthesis protein [Bradyrhizobium japonicum]MCS3501747.1 O-antigen/teichoic acid export membrane protein [Bradyrhizobium japonicum]MCS3965539.1 O-antigen/teichoic acid export membrane protein [Bradyrhizobium japonicum]MCS3997846.1 O-antigen/teichoic acid export membrane protein [Bradyrhizobium japonicum]
MSTAALPNSSSHLLIDLMVMAMRASVMGCKFGLALFIARYLDLSSLGLYGLAAGAIAAVPIVVNLGMNHLLMRDAVTASTSNMIDSMRHYWFFVAFAYTALLTIATLVTILFGTTPLWVIIVAVIMFEHVGNDIFYLLSSLQRHVWANAIGFIRGAAWILVYVPLAVCDASFRSLPYLFGFWLVGGVASVGLFAFLSRSWPWLTSFSRPFRLSVITDAIRRSYLMLLSDLGFITSQYIDRYLITLFLGLKVAGIYFLFWTVGSSATTFLALVLQQKQRPSLISTYRTSGLSAHRQLAWRFLQKSALATVVLSTAVGFAFQVLLPWIAQPALVTQWSTFWLIVAGLAVRYMADFGALALFTAHLDRMTTVTNLASVGVLVLAQLALLPIAGLHGAGAAILVASLIMALWRYWLLFGFPVSSVYSRRADA